MGTYNGNEQNNYFKAYKEMLSPQDYNLRVWKSWTMNGLTGNDTLYGGEVNDTINGGNDNDQLYGLGGNDTIYGGSGNDILDGGSGNDKMYGGTGNDIYYVDSSLDSVVEYAGEGTDKVYSSISYTLGGNVENLTLTGTAYAGYGNTLNNVISGNSSNNYLSGGNGNDNLSGGSGNDTIYGGSGNDTLNGGSGADKMYGGTHNDIYYVDSSLDSVVEYANEGTDTVNSSIYSYTLGANVENLTLTGTAYAGYGNSLNNELRGNSSNNYLNGGVGNDILYGNGGNDVLNGGEGVDTMYGGTGDDTYYVDRTDAWLDSKFFPGDVVSEKAAEGYDTVYSSVNYTLTANVERLFLTGNAISGSGNNLDNAIDGNSANNRLYGYDGNDYLKGSGGNDTIYGGSGNDYLDGGSGADTMYGGTGDDTYFVDSLPDRVGTYSIPGDSVLENAAEGYDTVQSSVNYTLTANVERLFLTGNAISGSGNNLDNAIYGTSANNRLYGYGGNDYLSGGIGNDTMYGGTGNDTYYIDSAADVVVEYANEGTDTVISSIYSYTLGANVENLTLTSSASGTAYNGIGNSLNNEIQGNNFNNDINGGAGNDTLYGHAGSDILLGSQGTDVLYGGEGNDILNGYGYNSGGNDYDTLVGEGGADTFVLGNNAEAFYTPGGYYGNDGYAKIKDFSRFEGDKILVHGSIGDYSLKSVSQIGLSNLDTAIYYKNELIAIAADTTNVNLATDFIFT